MSQAQVEPVTPFQREELKIKWYTLYAYLGTVLVAAIVALVGYCNLRQQVEQFEKSQSEQIRQFQERFIADQQVQREQRQKDYRLKFYEKQMEVYLELCELVSRIAVSPKPTQTDIHIFDQLVIGKVAIVADESVVEAVQQFNAKLKGQRPMLLEPTKLRMPPQPLPTLQELAYNVSAACRRSLQKAFPGVEIGFLMKYGALMTSDATPEK